jgi:diguanylate cyclase (GGDEF)-like protein/PAS domain S-box-containing protein
MPKASILIVEDEQIVALDIQNSLEKNGFQVVGRTDRGEDAVKKAEELHPDLILMDITLKGNMDGIEAAIQIRERLHIPIIFLTAFSTQSIVERAQLAEPFGYIVKPFNGREKIIAIEMALYKHGMEKKLRESENKFRSVIEHASDGIALIDTQGQIVEWNPAMEQITGLTRAEVIDQPIWKISFRMLPIGGKTAEASEAHALSWKAAIENGFAAKNQMTEREIETPEGIRRVIQSNGFALETSQGAMAGVIMRDITDRKKMELAELDQRRLAEALRDSAIALNSTLKLDEILDRILANIGTLVNYDTAMVSLIEGDTTRKTRYHNNPQNDKDRLRIGDMQAALLNIPILKTIIKTKQPHLIPDIHDDARWQSVAIPEMQRIRSLICVPFENHGSVVGMITVISATPGFFTSVHTERIMAFAHQAAVAFENARLFERAEYLSVTDPLTELFNMRYFHDFANLEFERVKRYARTLSVAMLDIDHFKSINDQYGHSMGDQALREISRRIKASVRAVDVIARYGGEEFIILMPETPLHEALAVAERVRRNMVKNLIESDDSTIAVTMSLGVAEMKNDTQSLDELIKLADKALYDAKAKGRNRVEGFSHGE